MGMSDKWKRYIPREQSVTAVVLTEDNFDDVLAFVDGERNTMHDTHMWAGNGDGVRVGDVIIRRLGEKPDYEIMRRADFDRKYRDAW